MDLQSLRSAVLLIRNELQYFAGHAGSCCRLGDVEETMYTGNH